MTPALFHVPCAASNRKPVYDGRAVFSREYRQALRAFCNAPFGEGALMPAWRAVEVFVCCGVAPMQIGEQTRKEVADFS